MSKKEKHDYEKGDIIKKSTSVLICGLCKYPLEVGTEVCHMCGSKLEIEEENETDN